MHPGVHTESETLAGYLEAQLAAIRASAHGLTDEQSRLTPCRSALSIGGLLKHATDVMRGRQRRRDNPGAGPDEQDYVRFMGSFAMTDDETLESTLAAFDAAVVDYLADVAGTDPDASDLEPPAPWAGILEPTPSNQRFYLVHHIEELARHAGHADIIREQIDGAGSLSLVAAIEGRPANPFVQPWELPA